MSNTSNHYDLIVRGGTVVNGSGLARRRGDVAVRDGVIVKVGVLEDDASADSVIDASGMIVAPGIVDLHTHYDPQLTFDPHASCSCYHGVTTIVAGNCGFSIAPVRSDAASSSASEPDLCPIVTNNDIKTLKPSYSQFNCLFRACSKLSPATLSCRNGFLMSLVALYMGNIDNLSLTGDIQQGNAL